MEKIRWKKILTTTIALLFLALIIVLAITPLREAEPPTGEPQPEDPVLGPFYAIEKPARPQILARIAHCESGDRHYTAAGDVIRGSQNGSDIGRYQINLYYHGDQAERLGLNLFNEDDNEAFAIWLYEKNGTQPWAWSKSCWS